MTVRAALYERLKATPDLVAVVGTRIYPLNASDTVEAPWCLYRLVSQEPRHVIDGAYSNSAFEFEIGLFGPSYDQLDTAASALDASLGSNAFEHAGQRYVSHLQTQRDDYEPEEQNFVIFIDLTIQEQRS